MRQLLRFLRWDAFAAYGVVPAGESTTVRLPAGAVSIAFESRYPGSRRALADLPSIADDRGREVPIAYTGAPQGPSITKSGFFADQRIRRRFATAKLPAPGDYFVRASGSTVLLGSARV
jgi:hypothetical protein